MSLLMESAGPSAVLLSETNAALHRQILELKEGNETLCDLLRMGLLARDRQADKLAKLTAALQQISDMGPMSVDDQRWRIAREALTSGTPKALHPVASE